MGRVNYDLVMKACNKFIKEDRHVALINMLEMVDRPDEHRWYLEAQKKRIVKDIGLAKSLLAKAESRSERINRAQQLPHQINHLLDNFYREDLELLKARLDVIQREIDAEKYGYIALHKETFVLSTSFIGKNDDCYICGITHGGKPSLPHNMVILLAWYFHSNQKSIKNYVDKSNVDTASDFIMLCSESMSLSPARVQNIISELGVTVTFKNR